MRKIIFLFLLILISFHSSSQDWIKMFTNNGRTYYIYEKVKKVNNYNYSYTAWVKITFDTPTARANRKGKGKYVPYEEKILYAFSNDWSKIGTLQFALYRKNGDVIDSNEYFDSDIEMTNIIPGSIGESFSNWAKHYKPKTQQEISEYNASARKEAIKKGFIELPNSNGVLYKVKRGGIGPIMKENQLAKVIYKSYHTDGRIFDDSEGKSVSFDLQNTISGFSSAVKNMPVGSQWIILIPSSEGFGVKGVDGIVSPNEDLIMEIELVGLEDK